MHKEWQIEESVPTYNKDGRLRIQDLYRAFGRLESEFRWMVETVYVQEVDLGGHGDEPSRSRLSIISARTRNTGHSLWALFGVHGEEPAGPNALALSIEEIARLGKQVPVVIFPLLNPAGYVRNWRYSNEPRNPDKGLSVGDSDHLLLDNNHPETPQPRATGPSSEAASAVTKEVLRLAKRYPPILSIDHHEDEDRRRRRKPRYCYIYSHGIWGYEDLVGKEITRILVGQGMPITESGSTKFSEEIKNGIVLANDGSIDELLSTKKIIVGERVTEGPGTKTVIVVETPTMSGARERMPLMTRVAAHREIIKAYPRLLELRRQQEKGTSHRRVSAQAAIIREIPNLLRIYDEARKTKRGLA